MQWFRSNFVVFHFYFHFILQIAKQQLVEISLISSEEISYDIETGSKQLIHFKSYTLISFLLYSLYYIILIYYIILYSYIHIYFNFIQIYSIFLNYSSIFHSFYIKHTHTYIINQSINQSHLTQNTHLTSSDYQIHQYCCPLFTLIV